MKRKMGIDYGTARIGIAISDPLGITARGIETINWDGVKIEFALDRIDSLCKEHDIDLIVMGLPRRTDGKPSQSQEGAQNLAELINQKTGINIVFTDERYTTVIAHQIMRETKVKREKKKGITDQIAAQILLQDYLNHCKL